MKQTLADTLNAYLQDDGTLDISKVIATLEVYANADILESYYTGGTERQDEAAEAYAAALAWNSAITLQNELAQKNAARRGIRPFMFTLPILATLGSLLAVAASMI